MDIDDIDTLAPPRRRGGLFHGLLLLTVIVTWLLFREVVSYVSMGEGVPRVTGQVEGPATLGKGPALDHALAPLMQALGCQDISFEDPGHAAHRVGRCFFTFGGLPKGAKVRLLYGGDDTAIDDTSVPIRAGIAACLWLNFSIFGLSRIRR